MDKSQIERFEEKLDELIREIKGYNGNPGLVTKLAQLEVKQTVQWFLIIICLTGLSTLFGFFVSI